MTEEERARAIFDWHAAQELRKRKEAKVSEEQAPYGKARAETVADHIAYLRSRTYDQRAQRAAECMERLLNVVRLVEDSATIYTPAELRQAAREALGE